MPDVSDVSGGAGAPRGRDFWDKAQAIAGLATAVLVALIGGLSTYVYNQWQLSAQQPWQPASPTTGQTVHFDGTSSSCSSPCTYTWQDDGSDGARWHQLAPPPVDHTPVARFTASREPSNPQQTTTFDATSSTCEDTPCVYHWHDIDSSGTGNWPLGPNGSTMTFAFQGLGTKYVELVLTDADGDVNRVEHSHVVTNAPPPPPPSLDISNFRRDPKTDTASDGTIWASWDTPAAAPASYREWRDKNSNGAFDADEMVGTDPGTATSAVYGGGLPCGTTWLVGLEAVGTDGTIGPRVSAPMSVKACPPPPPPPTATCAQQPFCGDFETNDFSQYWQREWTGSPDGYTADQVGNSKSTIVTSPVAQGTYAAKCEVFPTRGTSTNDRCENLSPEAETTGTLGTPQFYGWWTYFPGPTQDWWHAGGDWNAWTQFGEYPLGSSWPGFGLDATADQFHPKMFVSIPAGKFYLGDLVYDHWYHVIVEAVWSHDPAVGYFTVWFDGDNVLPRKMGATLTGTADAVHISQGIYRGAYSSTNTVIDDGLCRAATYTDAAAC